MTSGMNPLIDIVDLKVQLKVEGGSVTVIDGTATGSLPGRVLRSGRDTETVATS